MTAPCRRTLEITDLTLRSREAASRRVSQWVEASFETPFISKWLIRMTPETVF
jgi:hypothetical protein